MVQVCVRAKVNGKVQGVGFRMWTKRQAELRGLCGWVRNVTDGAVEALIEGDKTNVDALLALLHKGPPAASVEAVDVEYIAAHQNYKDFQICR